jgi:hypothetical protein
VKAASEARGGTRSRRAPFRAPAWLLGVLRIEVACFLALFAFYLHAQETSTFPLIHGDGHYTYMWSRSLAFDHDLRLDNDYALCGDVWGLRTPAGPGLGPRNTWSPGPALVWVPLLVLGRLVLPHAAHSPDPQIAGACQGPIAAVAMAGTAAMAVLALALAFALARRYVGRFPALFGAMAAGLATPLFFYAMYAPAYGHVASAFGVAIFLERWDALRGRRTVWKWGGLGLALGAAMLTRPQTVILAVPAAIEWALAARGDVQAKRWRELRRHVLHGVLFSVAAILVFSPQFLAWKISYGHYLTIPMGPNYMRWGDPKIAATLFSTLSGLIPFSPILYASFFGVLAGLWSYRTRTITAALAVVMALELYIDASVWDFWGSGGFPARRFGEMALPFAVSAAIFADALAAWVRRRPERATNIALGTAFVACAIWTQNAVHPDHEGPSDEVLGLSFRAGARWVRNAVGDPLAWPASIPFAIRYRCHPRRYDRMTGYTAYYEDWYDLKVIHDTVSTTSADTEDFLVDDFARAPEQFYGELTRGTTGPAPRMLIPVFRPGFDRIQIRWAAMGPEPVPVNVRWNGVELPPVIVGTQWATSELLLPKGAARSGINEVVLALPQGHALVVTYLRMVQAAQEPK